MTVGQTDASLPRSTPEAQGICPATLRNFLFALQRGHELHSILLLRHGHVVAEGWSAPYRADAIHSLNSLSKSFTATAVGFAVAGNILDPTDKVVSFFRDRLPSRIPRNLRALTVEHLLTMSVGHVCDPTDFIVREDDWVKAFLAVPIENPPGTVFAYNSAATYMLSAIVQTVSGQKLVDYLETKLFDPLGIRDKHWETCPLGINTGGWGLSTTSESLAKFGQLYLQQGRWRSRQLLTAKWIDTATASRIQTGMQAGPSDWQQGYGYQFWRCRHGAYRGDGAFGQFCIVMPKEAAVLIMTGRTMDMPGMLDLVWQHVLPAMHAVEVPPGDAAKQLQLELASMALPPIAGARWEHTGAHRRFGLDSNELGARVATFEFCDDACLFRLEMEERTAEIRCGVEKWIDNTIDMPGVPPRFFTISDRRPVTVAGSAAWIDSSTLQMQWRFYETPHYDIVTCRFSGDAITIEFVSDQTTSLTASPHDPQRVLRGRASAS